MTTLADARALAHRHADLLAEHLPHRLVGLHLVGSAALDDLRPDSDVDTVTVVTAPLDDDARRRLAVVHDALPGPAGGAPPYDTTYVPAAWLRSAPVEASVTPYSLDGVLHTRSAAAQIVPPTWRELRDAVCVVGGPAAGLGLADVTDELRRWTLGNLHGYWAGQAATAREVAGHRPAQQPAGAEGVLWLVLGAARLHACLALDRIVSKTAAGTWVGRTWPAYAALAARCVAVRAGAPADFTTLDALAAADLVDRVVADADRF